MKKLHIFILKTYLGPLIMTFFISLFILVMQFLWRYVDDMVGKGLEVSVLAELLFYASVQVVPMALPLAILLASLMSFGNLGENYELTALKSAGISLPRIMSPLIIFSVIISVAAFKFSNNILPVANLKLYSLLWSVRQASPEFDIQEKVFYYGLKDFSIKIENKSNTSDMLYDIMIYDHRNSLAKNSKVTVADSGKLQISPDKKNLKLTLYDGVSYDENVNAGMDMNTHNSRISRRERQQFKVEQFKKQVTSVAMEGMDFTRFDEGLFKHNNRMKNIDQLNASLDSFNTIRNSYIEELRPQVERSYFVRYKRRQSIHAPPAEVAKDSTVQAAQEITELPPIDNYAIQSVDSAFNKLDLESKVMVLESAVRRARDSKNIIDQRLTDIDKTDYYIVRHKIEWHRKFTLSFACFIFFFIGAPLGAIIRKGGLGMPVVISVLFFIVYYIIDTFGLKVSKEEVWPPYLGIWLSSCVLFPLGVFLTYKAATDSSILNADAYRIFFQKLFSKFKR